MEAVDRSGRIDRHWKAAEHIAMSEQIAVLAAAVGTSRSARHENFVLLWSADQSDFVLDMIL